MVFLRNLGDFLRNLGILWEFLEGNLEHFLWYLYLGLFYTQLTAIFSALLRQEPYKKRPTMTSSKIFLS